MLELEVAIMGSTGSAGSHRRRHFTGRRWSALIAVLLTSACSWASPGKVVTGSGEVTSETRTVAAFTEVAAGAGIRLELATGPQRVVVTAQPNIADITTTTVSGSRLTIDATSGYLTSDGLVVKVTAPRFTALELSGGASASGTTGTTRELSLRLSGGARATLDGATTNLRIEASGGAIVELGGLRATNADVDLSGGVVASLHVTGALTGSASGGVVVTLTTKPTRVGVDTSGGAVVHEP
jgi:hypothetical protein